MFIISVSPDPTPELVVPFATTSHIAYREWMVNSGESSTTYHVLDIWRSDGTFLSWEYGPMRSLADQIIQARQRYLTRVSPQ
jgi:hypothetical protein